MASAKRDVLLRVHGYRLRREDLEDCYGQATLELVAHVRKGATFSGRLHVANALELRFLSRVRDRRRALSGRSPMQAALEVAASLDGGDASDVDVPDACAEVEKLVILRQELREIEQAARHLTLDQRRVLASQLADERCEEFCRRSGFSAEKYRKVAQRARAALRRRMELEERRVPVAARASE